MEFKLGIRIIAERLQSDSGWVLLPEAKVSI